MITKTVRNLINENKNNDVAITSDHAQTIIYSDLKQHIHNISGQLSFKGLTNKDRAAIVLPNGPEMATAFLAVSSYMSAAPLNPSYTFSEYEFYLNDLKPKIVIVEKNSSNPVVEAANKLNIEICEIKKIDGAPLGIFNLYDQQSNFKLPHEENEALVLHTSGTTSRPKVVPLTNKNIYSSAINISKTLKLTSNDHCFNIMPLFHIHGLIAILSASIGAGASVYASSGFNALKFLEKAKSENITWYSGVPTMHQAILMRAKRNLILAENLGLRFVRSSSASLPPAVFDQLRDVFKSPVIEAYGMTEATHQMTSNPMPPMTQKAGFVGKAAGPEVCVMDKNGNLLKNGLEGEVCIRGDNVTKGYENNDEANTIAYTNGWFRTGDQGFFDKDGYLKISGRLKEIINRGGEKISPLEVDNVLMEHEAIEQVVTFGVKDNLLGEVIGVAVVLKNNAECSEEEIKKYASEKLANFKIPKYICFLDEIPKGATGKLQRIGLAAKLGLE
ncbi:MAG: acyl--CoA ligase [Candidatus Puniceispirillales bacterium]|jgi:acyl-CoA synthetase (AMP-forming)/AMP-acid ligase II|tara:strand:- start:1501 stop:3006 length:1506 start_codon:yes stop_codon:yes gene_type:complete